MPAHDSTSPELVLVSPDLGAEARAALPDRPWEAFTPRPPLRPRPRLRTVVIRPGTRTLASVVPPSESRRSHGHLRAGRAVLLHVIVLALAFSALTWAAERTAPPTLGEEVERVPPPAPAPPGASTLDLPVPAEPPPPGARDYVFPGGVLRVTSSPRPAAVLSLEAGCAAGGRTPPLDLGGGAFAFAGRLEGAPASALVRGRLLGDGRVRVHVELRGPGCALGALDADALPG